RGPAGPGRPGHPLRAGWSAGRARDGTGDAGRALGGRRHVSLLGRRLEVANVGLDLFADELELQDVHVERVDWRPPSPAVQGALARLARHALVIAEQNDLSEIGRASCRERV